jgi:hypothetical protein
MDSYALAACTRAAARVIGASGIAGSGDCLVLGVAEVVAIPFQCLYSGSPWESNGNVPIKTSETANGNPVFANTEESIQLKMDF